ncbi:MAG: hypothetical protein GY811_31355 [Myxococcales bacterium]|nr:hypothetical protein [Myxococcales bacterium]
MSGIHLEGAWDSLVGGEVHLARLSRTSPLAAIGTTLGIASFAKTDGARLQLESYVGLRLSSDITLGIAIGPLVDFYPAHRPRVGAGGSIWLHAGVAPYVALTRSWGLGASDHLDISMGMRIPFSVASF